MPPFEGPKPKLSVGERAAAQNKKGAAEQSKKILQGLIAGINRRYKNDPKMRKQKLKELKASRKQQREKELKKQQSEYDEFLEHLKSLPAVPRKVDPQPDYRYLQQNEPPKEDPDPQNMAPKIKKGVLTRGAARGGPVGYSQRWKTGRKG